MADDWASEVVSGMNYTCGCCLLVGLLVGAGIAAFVFLTILLAALG